jgi:hypothetical protein
MVENREGEGINNIPNAAELFMWVISSHTEELHVISDHCHILHLHMWGPQVVRVNRGHSYGGV